MLAHHADAKITRNCSPSDKGISLVTGAKRLIERAGAFKPPQAAADSAWPISRSFR